MTVAAIIDEPQGDEDDDDLVAGVGMSSSVIGNSTDSESDEYMSLPPQKHLWLNCFVNAPSSSETHLNVLIDNACSPVLIRPNFADKLQL